jgi:hypothetical protein
VNEGNAMNLQTGKFTAPRPGIYFFSFTGLAEFPASSSLSQFKVILYLNGAVVGLGWAEEANTVAGQNDQVTVQSTLDLKKGDRVWLQIWDLSSEGVYLYDDSNHFTHFTGFMLEEDILESI